MHEARDAGKPGLSSGAALLSFSGLCRTLKPILPANNRIFCIYMQNMQQYAEQYAEYGERKCNPICRICRCHIRAYFAYCNMPNMQNIHPALLFSILFCILSILNCIFLHISLHILHILHIAICKICRIFSILFCILFCIYVQVIAYICYIICKP